MNSLTFFLGIGLMLLGAAIWRFRLVHLLSNINMDDVDVTKKGDLARYAGCFIILLGGIAMLLAYLIRHIKTERELLILLACTIPVVMAAVVFYLAGLKRYMKK